MEEDLKEFLLKTRGVTQETIDKMEDEKVSNRNQTQLFKSMKHVERPRRDTADFGCSRRHQS